MAIAEYVKDLLVKDGLILGADHNQDEMSGVELHQHLSHVR